MLLDSNIMNDFDWIAGLPVLNPFPDAK